MTEPDRQGERQRPPEHRSTAPESPLGAFIFRSIAVVMTCLLVYNVWADINVDGYEGYGTTVLLGPIIGGLLGLGEWLKKR